MRKLLLDTDAFTGFLAGDERIYALLARSGTVCMSTVVLGELHAGFRGGAKPKENTALLDRFLEKSGVEVVELTSETAEIFGLIMDNLRKDGNTLPINDVWIAAQAVETGAVLVTLDPAYRKIPGLRLWEEGLEGL